MNHYECSNKTSHEGWFTIHIFIQESMPCQLISKKRTVAAFVDEGIFVASELADLPSRMDSFEN